jgi:hypothetical protein
MKLRLLLHILRAQRGDVRWLEADLSAEMTPVDRAWFAAAVRMMMLAPEPEPELVQADDLQAGVSHIPRESQATA